MGSSSSIAEREKLQLLRPLQYCREREREQKNCNYYDRCSIAEREREIAITTTAPVLQIGRIAITTTAPILQREKLQLLRPLKYCRQRETAITTTAPVLQREKLQLLRPLRYCRKRELASTTTAPVLQREKLHLLRPPQYCKKRETIIAATLPAWQTERNCKSYDRPSVAETEKLQLLRPLQTVSAAWVLQAPGQEHTCRRRQHNCPCIYNRRDNLVEDLLQEKLKEVFWVRSPPFLPPPTSLRSRTW